MSGRDRERAVVEALRNLLGTLGPGGYFPTAGKTITDSARAALTAYDAGNKHYLAFDVSHTVAFDDALCNCGNAWPCDGASETPESGQ